MTQIDYRIFGGYKNLTTVVDQDNKDKSGVYLPHVKEIKAEAFTNCESLRSVCLPGVESIEATSFNGCQSLKDLDASQLQTITETRYILTSFKVLNTPQLIDMTWSFVHNWFNDRALPRFIKFANVNRKLNHCLDPRRPHVNFSEFSNADAICLKKSYSPLHTYLSNISFVTSYPFWSFTLTSLFDNITPLSERGQKNTGILMKMKQTV